MRSLRSLLALTSVALCAPAGASPVPTLDGQGRGRLEAKVLSYDGHTNGGMRVEVTNNGSSAETFTAQGLFFVPDGSPNDAPQRLGAVGPFVVDGDDARKDKVAVPPGGHVVVRLDVYCIDSHRRSPSPDTRFHLSATRMPRELSNDISHAAQEAAKPMGGVSSPAAKGAVQSEVWKNRDKKWIKLDGEGQQERSK